MCQSLVWCSVLTSNFESLNQTFNFAPHQLFIWALESEHTGLAVERTIRINTCSITECLKWHKIQNEEQNHYLFMTPLFFFWFSTKYFAVNHNKLLALNNRTTANCSVLLYRVKTMWAFYQCFSTHNSFNLTTSLVLGSRVSFIFLRHLHKLKTTTLCIKQNPDYFLWVISEVYRTTEKTSPEELGWSAQLVTMNTFRR